MSKHVRRRQQHVHHFRLMRFLWLEPFWLLLLAPSLLFTETFWTPAARPLLIVALFLFWPLRLKAEKPLLPNGLVRWSVMFLLLWIPVAVWASPDSELSWEVAGYLYFALALFVALCHWPPLQKDPKWIALTLLLLGVGLAVVGPEYFSVDPDKMLDLYQTNEVLEMNRTGSFTINPNILGAALTMILVLGSALVLWRNWLPWRWLPWLLVAPLLIMGNSLIISQSRSSWLALMLAGLALLWLTEHRRLLIFVVGTVFAGGILLWLTELLALLPLNTLIQSAENSLLRRTEIWHFSLEMVTHRPLVGVGLGVYEQVFAAHFPSLPLIGGRLAPPHAHNLLLQIALDLGLPGFVAWAITFAALCRRLLYTLPNRASKRYMLRAGVSAALLAMMIIGCFDNALWGTKLSFIPWTLFALAYLVTESHSSGRDGNSE